MAEEEGRHCPADSQHIDECRWHRRSTRATVAALITVGAVFAVVTDSPFAKLRQTVQSRRLLAASQAPSLQSVAQELLSDVTKPVDILQHVNGRSAWAEQLPRAKDFTGTVFYPFGGVDALSVMPIFPKASSINIVALHSVGSCDTSTWGDLIARKKVVADLMQGVFLNKAGGGYFGTEEMIIHCDKTGFGVTPFLLASLELLGHTVTGIECGADVKMAGSPTGLDAGKAVRIMHRSRSDPTERELLYMQVDLLTPSDSLDGLLAAVRAQQQLVTMMKATGYIIRRHADTDVNHRFGAQLDARPLRNTILSQSQAILQDDSGIRLSCLEGWHLSLWGEYIGPANLLNQTVSAHYDYDDSLRARYCTEKQEGNVQALPVRFGYPVFFPVTGCPTTYSSCSQPSIYNSQLGAATWSDGFALFALKPSSSPM